MCAGRPGQEHFGRSWYDAPFLWAESYFYRRLLGTVGYFGAGPWQGIDPFAPFKQAELRGEAVDEELRALDALASARLRSGPRPCCTPRSGATSASFRRDSGTNDAVTSALVADDSATLWQLLPAGASAAVAVVADNAGRELTLDLVLIDHLLGHTHAEQVVLHVKPCPYYISDALTADVLDGLRRLTEAPCEAGQI